MREPCELWSMTKTSKTQKTIFKFLKRHKDHIEGCELQASYLKSPEHWTLFRKIQMFRTSMQAPLVATALGRKGTTALTHDVKLAG